ncbi:MAG: cadherin-like beta sandwich domain-containing protein [Defluviitaleaceae bacterium]|nr:cadherin-like beta sandwich domain-containing protein [Defluviitaleaceae bacterium]
MKFSKTKRAIAVSLALVMSFALVAFNPFNAFAEDADFFFPTPSVVVEDGSAVLDEDGNPIVEHPTNENGGENTAENGTENGGNEDNGDNANNANNENETGNNEDNGENNNNENETSNNENNGENNNNENETSNNENNGENNNNENETGNNGDNEDGENGADNGDNEDGDNEDNENGNDYTDPDFEFTFPTPEVGANEDGNIVVTHPGGNTYIIEQEVPIFPTLPSLPARPETSAPSAPITPVGQSFQTPQPMNFLNFTIEPSLIDVRPGDEEGVYNIFLPADSNPSVPAVGTGRAIRIWFNVNTVLNLDTGERFPITVTLNDNEVESIPGNIPTMTNQTTYVSTILALDNSFVPSNPETVYHTLTSGMNVLVYETFGITLTFNIDNGGGGIASNAYLTDIDFLTNADISLSPRFDQRINYYVAHIPVLSDVSSLSLNVQPANYQSAVVLTLNGTIINPSIPATAPYAYLQFNILGQLVDGDNNFTISVTSQDTNYNRTYNLMIRVGGEEPETPPESGSTFLYSLSFFPALPGVSLHNVQQLLTSTAHNTVLPPDFAEGISPFLTVNIGVPYSAHTLTITLNDVELPSDWSNRINIFADRPYDNSYPSFVEGLNTLVINISGRTHTFNIDNQAVGPETPPPPELSDNAFLTAVNFTDLDGNPLQLTMLPALFTQDTFNYRIFVDSFFDMPGNFYVYVTQGDFESTLAAELLYETSTGTGSMVIGLSTSNNQGEPARLMVQRIAFGMTENTVRVTVTSPDGTVEQIYNFVFIEGEPPEENDDAFLTQISLLNTELSITPQFSQNVFSYTVQISEDFELPATLQLTVLQSDWNSSLSATLNGTVLPVVPSTGENVAATMNIPTSAFTVGANLLVITVLATDGETELSYTVNFQLDDGGGNLSDNALLERAWFLYTADWELNFVPQFNSNVFSYNVAIPNDFDMAHIPVLGLAVVPSNENATVAATFNGVNVEIRPEEFFVGEQAYVLSIPLLDSAVDGVNSLVITVTAEDGSTQTYTINFQIGEPTPPAINWDGISIGHWANQAVETHLPNFTFNPETFSYNVTIPAGWGVGHAGGTGLDISAIVHTPGVIVTATLNGQPAIVHSDPYQGGIWHWIPFVTAGAGLPDLGMDYNRLPAGASTVVVTVGGTAYTFNFTNNAAGVVTPPPGPGGGGAVTPPPAPPTIIPTVPTPPIVAPGAGPTAVRPRPSTRRIPVGTAPAAAGVTVDVNLSDANVVVNLPTRVNARGIATLNITDAAINQAVTAIRTSARDARESVNNFVVRVEATGDNINGANATLNRTALNRLVQANATLQIATGSTLVELDSAAMQSLLTDTRGNIRVTVSPPISLNATFRNAVGNNPVFVFSISATTSGTVRNLPVGQITLGIASDTPTLNVSTFANNQVTTVPSMFVDGWHRFIGLSGIFGLSN